ncbi:MAG: DUF3604 domain-containing protein [Phycisphaerales bacterium]|nr:MAG: DUF3604 domain-containing protein [Phycisphaerales bacterium]
MRYFICIFSAALLTSPLVRPSLATAATNAPAAETWDVHRFCIKWGIRSNTPKVWDGHARLAPGEILDVTPFIRHEIPYDSMLVSPTSWRSTTYTDAEGIYLSVRAPEDARVSIHTVSCDFAFSVGDLPPGDTRRELNGDIEVCNVTREILFRTAGLETGSYGKGTATIAPTVAQAGKPGTWTITYTAPEGGLPAGGGIRVSWHFTRSWGEPQFTNPTGKNYVTVRTDGKCRLDYTSEHRGLLEYPFLLGRILVRVLDEPLHEGEQIRVVLGDTREGSPGFEAPVVVEKAAAIRVEDCAEVPEGRFPMYRRLRDLPHVSILPLQEPHRLFIVAPSLVCAGSPFTLRVVVEDVFRNPVPTLHGQFDVTVGNRPIREVTMPRDDSGMLTIPDLVLDSPGAYWVTVRHAGGEVAGTSNPINCVTGPLQHRVVWAELHGHTQYSDGYGSADDYLRFARQRALLDVAAITDHDVELDAPDYVVADMWREVNAAVQRHHDPPRFCTVPAYEWSPARATLSTTAPYGDHNVYFEKHGARISKAEDADSHTLPKLYRCLDAVRDTRVQVIPHVGGAIGNWDYHHPAFETLAEIYSVHGGFEAFGEIALQKGYTVGFVGASDSHSGQIGGFPPGNVAGHYTHGGLTAAWVRENSRSAFLEALANRRVYATSGPRILLTFRINGQPMGTVIETDRTPTIEAEVFGNAPLLVIEVIKNGRVIHTWHNAYDRHRQLTLLWGNRVEQADLLDFDRSLWSYYIRHVDWRGRAKVDSGGLSLKHTCSFDYPKDRIVRETQEEIRWISQTRGDWDGVTLTLGPRPTGLTLELGPYTTTLDVNELQDGLTEHNLGASDRLIIAKGNPLERHATLHLEDFSILHRWNYYYLRVLQADGEMAWSSPVWISRRGE